MTFDDPIRGYSDPDRYWTTANIGEAVPDVMTPLCWSLWGSGNQLGSMRAWASFGLFDPADATVRPDQNDSISGVFYGRPAVNIDLVRAWLGRFPGMDAGEFELSITGSLRPDAPTLAPLTDSDRHHIAALTDRVATTHSERLERHAIEYRNWWSDEVHGANRPTPPRQRLQAAYDRFVDAIHIHNETRLLSTAMIAGVYRIAAEADRLDAVPSVFAAFGGVDEVQMAEDLWAYAHDELDLDFFLSRHGYHGENEGNPSGHSWREDPTPLLGIAKELRDRPDDERPSQREERAAQAQRAALDQLAAGLTPAPRAELERCLDAAAPAVREIERGKAAFLMAVDGYRAAARDLGDDLVHRRQLAARDDVFFLTLDELLAADLPSPLPDLIAFRRQRWNEYRSYSPVPTFTGMPDPQIATASRALPGDIIAGTPVSAGIVTGRARVVTRAATDDQLESGDILVCSATDPSWTPTFLLASAAVIDIGGIASHGAIVARELGIPAVVNTGDGSRRLRDGDTVTVDGTTGAVTVIATHHI